MTTTTAEWRPHHFESLVLATAPVVSRCGGEGPTALEVQTGRRHNHQAHADSGSPPHADYASTPLAARCAQALSRPFAVHQSAARRTPLSRFARRARF
mmetsp:Transcript_8198/g.17930  ORF Transcript_8198/g.17930 Transcript_8198/m.17930 type:complete len:98 (+) Transcript_8198:318-611(+)